MKKIASQQGWLEGRKKRIQESEWTRKAGVKSLDFLRAMHWRIPLLKVDIVPQKEKILRMIVETIEKAEPWK